MKTNDLKKGDWIILRELNWRGEMWDNMRGNTRVVDVYGWEHEAGSVYSHDILHKIVSLTGKTLPIDILKNVNITTDEIMKNNEFMKIMKFMKIMNRCKLYQMRFHNNIDKIC